MREVSPLSDFKLEHYDKPCVGERVWGDQRECGKCGRRVWRTNYAWYVRGYRENHEGNVTDVGGESEAGGAKDESRERTRGRVAECLQCGRTLSYINMARYQRTCRVWDPGGGPRPNGARMVKKERKRNTSCCKQQTLHSRFRSGQASVIISVSYHLLPSQYIF